MLARISVRTLIVKEWKETFWIITGGKLLLYRAKEDYLYVSSSTTQEHGLVWIMVSCVWLVSVQNPVGVQVKKDIPLRDNLRCSEVTCKVRESSHHTRLWGRHRSPICWCAGLR